jgi:hypothetical protein
MKDSFGNEIAPGALYKRTKFSFTAKESFNPNRIEVYKVEEKQGELIAMNDEGNSFTIEDPGWHDRNRIKVNQGSIDSYELTLLEGVIYEKLVKNLKNSQEKTSKLLQMLEK